MPGLTSFLRGMYSKGGKRLGAMSEGFFAKGGVGVRGVARALGGGATGAAGIGLDRLAGMSNFGMVGATGAAVGGLYGAFSDDTSVLGGMAWGAGIGMGSVGLGMVRPTLRAIGPQLASAGRKIAASGRAAAASAASRASAAGEFIGSAGKRTRAVNPIQGMRSARVAVRGPSKRGAVTRGTFNPTMPGASPMVGGFSIVVLPRSGRRFSRVASALQGI